MTEATKEKRREYSRKYYHSHKEACKKRMKKHSKTWKAKHAKRCADYHIRIKYGLSREQYDKMYLEQLGLCAICHEPFGDKKPVVDHCHNTEKVRGLVHRKCNCMLGYADDNAEKLVLAAEYLRKHQN